MMSECEQMDREKLAAWVDGALADAGAQRMAAAHVAACPRCAAAAALLQAHKDRLARFRTTTTPAALPPRLWETTRAALDRVDVHRRATGRRQRRPAPRRRIALGVAAAVAALLIIALTAAVVRRHRPGPVVPVQALLAQPLLPAGGIRLSTDDPDHAASWLGHQLRAAISPVNLSLAGARIVAAQADPAASRGTLFYRGAQGAPIALHIFLAPGTTLPALPAVTYDGSAYSVAESRTPPAALAAWQADGRTYAAAARLPLARLLPYVHEMDRSCRHRPPP